MNRAVAMHIIEADHHDLCIMKDDQWPKHPLEKCDYCDLVNLAYAAALRDAVEAVGRIVPVWNPMVDASVVDGNEVMAAIEALQRQQAAVELTRMAQEDGLL